MDTTQRGGSIYGKVLVVIFGLGLIFSLFYPKKLWDEVAQNIDDSRTRMINIWTAETFYKSRYKSFTDTMEVLVEKLSADSMFYILQDSLMTIGIDSITLDPINGNPYKITLQDSMPFITIKSPVEPCTTKVFGLFQVEIENPGYIEDGKPSWEM